MKDHNSGNNLHLQDLDHYKYQYVPILNNIDDKRGVGKLLLSNNGY